MLPVSVSTSTSQMWRPTQEREVGRIVERALSLRPNLQLLAGGVAWAIWALSDHLAPGRRLVGAGDAEFAVLEFDVALGRFEHVGGDLLGLGLDPDEAP